jgi:2-oxo-4-hydroxy-4-carboxy-5-ureidoimidazoline decarboxylase
VSDEPIRSESLSGPDTAFAPDALSDAAFGDLVAPLFERAPRFIARLAERRPYGSWENLFMTAFATAKEMPREEQLELIDAHPRIGAPPGSVSALSFVEQGYDREEASIEAEAERQRTSTELSRLNDAYEARFGFRYVIFVAGRRRAAIVPLLEAALHADAEDERERALEDVVAIARDRAIAGGLLDGPSDARAPSRQSTEVAR